MKFVRLQSGQRQDPRIKRRGLTLLEMLLAAAILALSLAVLARQNGVGVRAALRSQLETKAAVLCQSQLNRLLAKNDPVDTISERPLTDVSSESHRWMWSVRVEQFSVPGLRLVTVTVFVEGIHREISTVTLSRLMPTEPLSSLQSIAGGRSR